MQIPEILHLRKPYIKVGAHWAEEKVNRNLEQGYTRYECLGCHNVADSLLGHLEYTRADKNRRMRAWKIQHRACLGMEKNDWFSYPHDS